MKHLILMNPVRRRRGTARRRRRLFGAALAAHQRRLGRRSRPARRRRTTRAYRPRRRVRRNPVAVARRRTHSPAMRAKIGRAVRAAQRRRSGGFRSRVTTVFARRSSRRRSGGGGFGGVGNPFKAIFSRQTLTVAAGAVASSFVTQFVLTRFGAQLPMVASPIGRVAYKLVIPAAGAALVKRFNRDLASGMLIGGAVMAINELIAAYGPKSAQAQQIAALKAYGEEYDASVDGGMPEALSQGDDGMGEYFAGEADFATNTYMGDNPFDSAPAFKNEF